MNIKIKHIFYIFLILTLFLTLGMVSANEDNVNQKVSLKEAANVDTTPNSDNVATVKENNNEKIKNNNPTEITANPKKTKINIQKNKNKKTNKKVAKSKKQKIGTKIILASKRWSTTYKRVGHDSELRYSGTLLKLWNPPETYMPLKIVQTKFVFKNMHNKKIIIKTIKKVYTERYPAGNFATITLIKKIKPYYKPIGAKVYYKRAY